MEKTLVYLNLIFKLLLPIHYKFYIFILLINMSQISNFVIYGERCSGTNFLENAIKQNFYLELNNELGSKHFFCFNKYNKSFDKTLFIGIIRNPIYWINSFSKELHHVPPENKNINAFINNPFYSVDDNTNNIIIKDLNYLTLQKYKNIFELRKLKNFFLINVMKKKVKNYILINYESLLYNYNYTLDFIKDKFQLTPKYTIYQPIKQYKKSNSYKFVKQRNILLSHSIVNHIWKNIYIPQENRLGYFKGDNNEFFKNKANISFITSF